MAEPRESLQSRILVPVAIAVLGALLVGGSAPWWWDRVFPPASTTSPGSTVAPPTFGPTPAISIDVPGPTAAVSVTPELSGCVLTITNPFATIRDQPSHQATEIGDVPAGEYPSMESTLVDWAGRDERWFKITASGRTGWIVYNTIMIESKSADCP